LTGNDTTLQLIGNNFFDIFSVSADRVRIRIGTTTITNCTISNENTINCFLNSTDTFTVGANQVNVSLDAGNSWTQENIVMTFFVPCPGGKKKKNDHFFL
jgi:hypothetical protein